VKPTTPIWLLKKVTNRTLEKLVPLKRGNVDGLQYYWLRKGSPPQGRSPIQRGVEFHDRIGLISGNIAIDVGANIGSYTLRLARNFRQVLAFEPNPQVSSILRMNVAANKFHNVTVNQIALSEAEGMLPIHIDPKHEGHGSLNPLRYGVSYDEVIPVVVRRMDDYYNPLERVDFVKIDVEGLELQVLKGGIETISVWRPLLAVEIHCPAIRSAIGRCACETCSYLSKTGYDVEVTGESQAVGPVHWVWASAVDP